METERNILDALHHVQRTRQRVWSGEAAEKWRSRPTLRIRIIYFLPFSLSPPTRLLVLPVVMVHMMITGVTRLSTCFLSLSLSTLPPLGTVGRGLQREARDYRSKEKSPGRTIQ